MRKLRTSFVPSPNFKFLSEKQILNHAATDSKGAKILLRFNQLDSKSSLLILPQRVTRTYTTYTIPY